MSDRGYILIRTIEPQVSMAEQDGMNEVWMTTGFVREIIDVLRAQEADIVALKNAYKELAEKGDVVIRCKYCKHFDCSKLYKCRIHGSLFQPKDANWFCADGERQEGDDHEETVAGGG